MNVKTLGRNSLAIQGAGAGRPEAQFFQYEYKREKGEETGKGKVKIGHIQPANFQLQCTMKICS